MIHRKYFIVVLLILLSASSLFAYEPDELFQLYEQLDAPVVNIEQTYEIANDTIFHNDFIFVIDSGRIAFCNPIVVEADTITFGAYFKGEGRVVFSPAVQMERDQLSRFVHSDSIDKKITDVLLFFSPELFESLKKNLVRSANSFSDEEMKKFAELYETIQADEDFISAFELLRNLTSPIGKPFLLTSVDTQSKEKFMYMFNPYLREEIRFWIYNFQTELHSFEQVNSYSQYNLDESYYNINGRDKSLIDISAYEINTEIDKNKKMRSKAIVYANVLSGPTDLLQFRLLPTLHVDSILDNKNQHLLFKREKSINALNESESPQVVVFLNEEIFYKDRFELTFYYHGEISNGKLGDLYLFSGANWYPTYRFRDKAIFDLSFKTDRRFTFTSCGESVERELIADTLFTKWLVKPEAANVSFNYGYMKKYKFESDDVVPVEIFYSKELHSDIAQYLSKDILIGVGSSLEKQVSEDVTNAMLVFNHYFGAYQFPELKVSEIIKSGSKAYPGYIHLGFDSWVNSESWEDDRLDRAREVARQWWGVGVGYETYHDQWLSDGFSEYAALLYYQRIGDNQKFFQKLKESRNDIFSTQQSLYASGVESGPIALGYRSSNSKESENPDLVIYKKSAFILHMLRNMMIDLKTMNEDSFFAMLKEFYGLYRGKDVNTHDFQRIAEKHSGIKLDWFFDQWIYHNYLPEYEFTYKMVHNDSTKLLDVFCTIKTQGVPDDFKMYVPLEIQFNETSKVYLRLLIDSKEYTFNIPSLSRRPRKIILNPFESVLVKIKQ